MNLDGHKGICTVVLLLAGALGCAVPYMWPAAGKNRRLISWFTALGGGAFIGLLLFHLVPEATGTIDGTHSHDHDSEGKPLLNWKVGALPLRPAYILMFIGFAAILFIERVLFVTEEVEALHVHALDHKHHPGSTVVTPVMAPLPAPSAVANSTCVDDTEEKTRSLVAARARLHSIVQREEFLAQPEPLQLDPAMIEAPIAQPETADKKEEEHCDCEHGCGPQTSPNTPPLQAIDTHNHSHDDHHGHSHTLNLKTGKPMTAYMMMVALSLHNVFEGLLIGIADSASSAWLLTASIIVHHVFAGLALAMGFAKQGVLNTHMAKVALGIFIVTGPIGAVIGLLVGNANELATGVINCIAAGVVLYVALVEIIAEEFAAGRHRKSKFCFLLLGVLILLFVSAWHVQIVEDGHHHHDHDHDDHEHGHEHCHTHDDGEIHCH